MTCFRNSSPGLVDLAEFTDWYDNEQRAEPEWQTPA